MSRPKLRHRATTAKAMSNTGTPVLLSLGSNVGDSVSNILAAIDALQTQGAVANVTLSRWYRTEPVGYADQPMFVNVAVAATTVLPAVELVQACKHVERFVGRTLTERWRQREIDVDVILVGDVIVNDGDVCVPHPRMHERMFVLQPANDVAPMMIHPGLGKSVQQLMNDCADSAAVECFDPNTA